LLSATGHLFWLRIMHLSFQIWRRGGCGSLAFASLHPPLHVSNVSKDSEVSQEVSRTEAPQRAISFFFAGVQDTDDGYFFL